MLETTNLKLKKYQDNDVADPSLALNLNMDILDLIIGDISKLPTEDKKSLVNSIIEIKKNLGEIDLAAKNVTLEDLENLFTSINVEGALKEVMTQSNNNKTSISSLQKQLGNNINLLDEDIKAIREVL